jgi:hypothetical protein
VSALRASVLCCVSACGSPTQLPATVSEMGFVEVDAQAEAGLEVGHMFYVLFPADTEPETKPLFVVFNGGPGFPTSLGLLADGTGPARVADDGSVVASTASFTTLGNVLYLDQRQTGFSYDDPPSQQGTFTVQSDTLDFTRAIVRVLDRHAALQGAHVILVAESYGGMRAQLVLDTLLGYADKPVVRDELQRHFDAVFPATAGGIHARDEIARQFFAQVLIEPTVMGTLQENASHVPADQGCTADTRLTTDRCPYLPPPEAIVDPDRSAVLFGGRLEDLPDVAGRHGARNGSHGDDATIAAIESGLVARLGALDPGDAYVALGPYFGDDDSGAPAFVANLALVRTFITHATYDGLVDSAAIAPALAAYGDPVSERPGWIDVTLASGPIEIRFPTYAAGHVVTLSAGDQLRSDIAAWLELL